MHSYKFMFGINLTQYGITGNTQSRGEMCVCAQEVSIPHPSLWIIDLCCIRLQLRVSVKWWHSGVCDNFGYDNFVIIKILHVISSRRDANQHVTLKKTKKTRWNTTTQNVSSSYGYLAAWGEFLEGKKTDLWTSRIREENKKQMHETPQASTQKVSLYRKALRPAATGIHDDLATAVDFCWLKTDQMTTRKVHSAKSPPGVSATTAAVKLDWMNTTNNWPPRRSLNRKP